MVQLTQQSIMNTYSMLVSEECSYLRSNLAYQLHQWHQCVKNNAGTFPVSSPR